ncbi:MAG: hypothetical protein LBP33_02790, partial [Candidatus Adiutrix sp.]|nr:hypothetical protein [Candidatus Adiutrix sp.]
MISSSLARAMQFSDPVVSGYAFHFKAFSAEEVAVTIVNPVTFVPEPLVYEADYSVTGLGQDAGGAVVLTPAGRERAGTGQHLVILRAMDFLQLIDYRPHDTFPAETHERALDRLTMMCQELREKLGRAVIAPPDQLEPIQYSELVALKEEAVAAAAEAAEDAAETEAARA